MDVQAEEERMVVVEESPKTPIDSLVMVAEAPNQIGVVSIIEGKEAGKEESTPIQEIGHPHPKHESEKIKPCTKFRNKKWKSSTKGEGNMNEPPGSKKHKVEQQAIESTHVQIKKESLARKRKGKEPELEERTT